MKRERKTKEQWTEIICTLMREDGVEPNSYPVSTEIIAGFMVELDKRIDESLMPSFIPSKSCPPSPIIADCSGDCGGCSNKPKADKYDYFDGHKWVTQDRSGKCTDCTDCKCTNKEEKAECSFCEHWSLLGGFCTKGEEKCTSECFERAKQNG